MGIIYVATNKSNNKKYVGQTRRPLKKRLTSHTYDVNHGCNLPFCRALRKYGISGFTFEEFSFPNNLLDHEEIKFISKLKTNIPYGYNISNGGGGTLGRKYIMSDDHKAKIATGRICKKHTEETKQFISNLKTGKKLPDFTKEHIILLSKSSTIAWGKRVEKYIFTDPNGKEHIANNGFRRFCEEHGIRRDMMQRVMVGKVKQNHHRGWKVRKID